MTDVNAVIKYPVATEKAIRLMEAENKLVFVVDECSSKLEVKKAVEFLFQAKVNAVNTHVSRGKKFAIVSFDKASPALDIATGLGLV